MKLEETGVILITGATGLVGSHVAEQAMGRGLRVRALARAGADTRLLKEWGVEVVTGDLSDPQSLRAATTDASVIVHCAAMVGDWGATEDYRRVNVEGTRALIDAAMSSGSLQRWVQISSLGVYEGTDHYGTDESTQPSTLGIDGYTLTKVESERLVLDAHTSQQLPAVVLRPGFIYGPRDRTVMPRLLERLRSGKFAYLGGNDKVLNNTYVGNLCEAVWLAIERDDVVGEVFNIRDGRCVTRKEFIETICEVDGCPVPKKTVPLGVAKVLASVLESAWRLMGKKEAPVLNSARLKFLALNLEFSIEKAEERLGYAPATDFRDAMTRTVEAFRSEA